MTGGMTVVGIAVVGFNGHSVGCLVSLFLHSRPTIEHHGFQDSLVGSC